ncbi:MAG TPA: glycosyltransferase [Gemmatimonadaceae bacterium]|nr:glycosyltransferase [Gemmatimonadaceae bacterium]
MKCSVVVPTHQRADLLDRLLASLVHQDLADSAFEIIICDDARSVETREQVRRWAAKYVVEVRYASAEGDERGPAAARNLGWKAARAPIIAFTDDDTVPAGDWLRRGLAAFVDGVDAVTGRVVVPLSRAPTDHERNTARLGDAAFVTANCFCRRVVLERLGGFDARFRAAWREDSDLHFRLLEHGYRVANAPDAVVVHPVRAEGWGASLRAERKHVFDALLYKLHPEHFRRFIGRECPPLYYMIPVMALFVLVGVLAGRPWIAGPAAAGWLAATAVLTARRLRSTSRRAGHVFEMIVTTAALPFLSLYWRLRGGIQYRTAFW